MQAWSVLAVYAYNQLQFCPLWEHCGKASWVGWHSRLSWRCHYICQRWHCYYSLYWRYTLTSCLECLGAHGTAHDFSWSTLPLVGFYDGIWVPILPWHEGLPPGIIISLMKVRLISLQLPYTFHHWQASYYQLDQPFCPPYKFQQIVIQGSNWRILLVHNKQNSLIITLSYLNSALERLV